MSNHARCSNCKNIIKKKLFWRIIYKCEYYSKVDTWLGHEWIKANPKKKNKNRDCEDFVDNINVI